MSVLPFLPFTRPDIDEATIAAVADTLRSGWITTGPRCKELEQALSARFGGRPVRLANSGTDRKSTRLNSSHIPLSRMPSSA